MSLAGMPSMNEIWGWHQELAKMGPRYTGSSGQANFIKWLKKKFNSGPGINLNSDPLKFQCWLAEPKDCSLFIQDPTRNLATTVDFSYYYPYSGKTGPNGITARLVDLGLYEPIWYTPAFWARASGAIALVRVPPCICSLDFGQLPTGGFEHGQTELGSLKPAFDYARYARAVTNVAFQGIFAAVPLLEARQAGVLGVICVWTGMSDDQVANQYNPLTTGYPNDTGLPTPNDDGCPALWVTDGTGRWLADCAAIGQPSVTLTLKATITPDAPTETLWGVLPGSGPNDNRCLIVNSHTDGPNVPEENGPLGMLALAQFFSRPEHRLRRDLYFVMATGHFQLPQFIREIPNSRFVIGNDAISRWMTDHPDIYQKALAAVSIEHLGCTRWADDANGNYVPTGEFEWGTTYTTQRQGFPNQINLEQQAYLEALRDTDQSGDIAYPVVTMLPTPLYFGEGAPLYAGGLGTISLCPLPSYLLQAGSQNNPGNLNKLDKRLIYGQILSFARTIMTLDAKPASDF